MTKVILTIDLAQTIEEDRLRDYLKAYFSGRVKASDMIRRFNLSVEEGQRLIAGLVSNAVSNSRGCSARVEE